MGMDVYGKAPTSEKGKYFRNNVWWWRPLADFILDTAPDDLTSRCEHWHLNDGDGLDAATSKNLAAHLRQSIASGAAEAYIDKRASALAGLPRETCPLCNGSGVRSDAIGKKAGQDTRKIEEDGHPRNGQVGWCNGCDGRGDKEPWAAGYHINIENIEGFAVFLEDCGGFEIC
jgi:hypothetical protein